MADGIDQLTTFEKDLLLRWFFYHLGLDQRDELMHQFPLIYNKAVGREVMTVTNQAHANLPVKCPICQTGAEGESTYRHEICATCRVAKHWECLDESDDSMMTDRPLARDDIDESSDAVTEAGDL